jgi:hypothetical protein
MREDVGTSDTGHATVGTPSNDLDLPGPNESHVIATRGARSLRNVIGSGTASSAVCLLSHCGGALCDPSWLRPGIHAVSRLTRFDIGCALGRPR